MKHKLESRLLEEISITSDMQMTPPLHKGQITTVPHAETELFYGQNEWFSLGKYFNLSSCYFCLYTSEYHFNTCLFSSYYVPVTVLNARRQDMNQFLIPKIEGTVREKVEDL